jgi:hypothetical protein
MKMQTSVSQPPVTQKRGHGCLTVVLVFIAMVTIIGVAINKIDVQTSSTTSGKYIAELNESQAKSIDKILVQCEVAPVLKITHDELLDNAHKKGETGYRITTQYADNVILYLNKDKTVNLIKYADHNLYAKGNVKASLQNYIIDMDEVNKLMIQCEDTVKSILKSPSTAKFPNYTEWGFTQKKKEVYLVSGYVDAQNSFGAENRSNFSFKIKKGSIVSFVFDGQEMIK